MYAFSPTRRLPFMPRHLRPIIPILVFLAQSGFAPAQEQKSPEAHQVVATSANETMPPVLLSQTNLQNCPQSLVSKTRFEGTTDLHAQIDPAGQATDVTITNSSGSPSLDDAAVACLKKAHFQAALREGKPVAGQFQMSVKWEIPPSAVVCSPSMPIAWAVEVSVTPSPTDSSPLPPVAESLVCACMNGTKASEPIILRSSGSQRLDEGAIKLMKQAPRSSSQAGCFANEFRFITKPAPHSDSGR
jgi:TonB family protein